MRVLTFLMTSEGEMRSLPSYLFNFSLMSVRKKKKRLVWKASTFSKPNISYPPQSACLVTYNHKQSGILCFLIKASYIKRVVSLGFEGFGS